MTRFFLDAIYHIGLSVAAPYWLYKFPQARRYRAGLLERLGFVQRRESGGKCVWIHCASVGEASIPRELVTKLHQQHPDLEVVFSTFTDTGAERLRKLYPESIVFYWPLDLSGCVDRTLDRIQPDLVLLVEQELWPNFLLGCRQRHVPVGIINGRIRASSVSFVRGLHRLFRSIFDPIEACCARSEEDARRYEATGLDSSIVHTTGSLKYDALPTEVNTDRVEELRELFGMGKDAPVLVAGSTHPGEEKVLCRVWKRLREVHSDLNLILVPRHIERADRLQSDLESEGYEVVRKTELEGGQEPGGDSTVVLVDTIGDLVDCYGLATCVFVGRSLLPPGGGQNMMEPAALGRAVVVGPHTGNFDPEMEMLEANKAVSVVTGERELENRLSALLDDMSIRNELGQRARRTIMENQGAADRTLEVLEKML